METPQYVGLKEREFTTSLKRVPITPDKYWQIVGKTNPVTLDQVPLLVKEMRESFLTHKYANLEIWLVLEHSRLKRESSS